MDVNASICQAPVLSCVVLDWVGGGITLTLGPSCPLLPAAFTEQE